MSVDLRPSPYQQGNAAGEAERGVRLLHELLATCPVDLIESVNKVPDDDGPWTLASFVDAEGQARLGDRWTTLRPTAIRLAEWARAHHPDDTICAKYGVEAAWWGEERFVLGSLMVEPPPHWQLSLGTPCPYRGKKLIMDFVQPLPLGAIWELQARPSCLPAALRDYALCEAPLTSKLTWLYQSDTLRPPLQALRLVAEATGLHGPTLALELGHSVGPQALTALSGRSLTAYSDIFGGNPFLSEFQGLVVLGLASQAARLTASMLCDYDLIGNIAPAHIQKIQRDYPPTFAEHVPDLIFTATEALTPNGVLALVCEPQLQHKALQEIRSQGLVPVTLQGLDTSKKAVWVRYLEPVRTPGGLLPPSDRLVSFWGKLP